MEQNIFTKQWWTEALMLNETTDNEVEAKVVKGFKLYPFKLGFGRSFKTTKGKASRDLANRINTWIKKKFPESHVTVAYEGVHSCIRIFNPNILHESDLYESSPIEYERDAYQDYVLQNEDKIEKAAYHFNIPTPDMEYAFNSGNEVVLNDDIWSKLENSESYKIKTLDDAIQYALKKGINPKPYIDAIKDGKEIPLPMVLCYYQDRYYLVGGDVILALYKALGSIPTVLQAVLNLKINEDEEDLTKYDGVKLDDNQTKTIKDFLRYAIGKLQIQQQSIGLTLSYNNKEAKSRHSFGTFDPNTGKIWVYVKNRNMADILRTLAHELVHRKQDEDGRIDYGSGETGSEIENEANAQAGILLRDFGKQNDIIYEGIYGDHLFGDKKSGVKIGWYKDEIEKDTPSELELFNLLKKYADSERETYSNINLDSLIPTFKKLKKQYPEIIEPKISSDAYIYRGTAISEEKLNGLKKEANTEPYNQGQIILDQTYSSRRKVSSWSTAYFPAAGFAVTTAEEKGGVPVIMRAKAGDANLFFNPKFMEKLSTQLEDETFNIANPIPVDIMVLKNYKDDYEDIEAGYFTY